jgi:outer membrane protein OmpA-like peptidoglycan-associated protein
MPSRRFTWSGTTLALALLPWAIAGQQAPRPASAAAVARANYLAFAEGALPIRVGGDGISLGATFTHALQIVDGNPAPFTIVSRATDATDVEFVYLLPAPTTFDSFSVPNVVETPSPSQTFFERVEIHGSNTSADEGWQLLAEGRLATHQRPEDRTGLEIRATTPVRWVRVRLSGGIQMLRDEMFLEFGELVGNGVQETPPLAEGFTGAWRGRGVRLTLKQKGAVVSGCYDTSGELNGTVTGNLLRATGVNRSDNARSAFMLTVAPDGAIRGVSSTNGAPFRLYEAPPGLGASCPEPPPPVLGCGSVVHGIRFGFDSAEIKPDSAAILEQLHEGLRTDSSASITIEGHTSDEGAEGHNQALSERRAAAVRTDLMRRGIPGTRLRVAGAGESRPLVDNRDETGRSINRRVEVHCK